MKFMRKWLAPVLAIAIMLGDCGGISLYAKESIPAMEMSVSENDAESPQESEDDTSIPDEMTEDSAYAAEEETESADDDDARSVPDDSEGDEEPELISDEDGTASAAELPALRIGQIRKGEALPASDDSDFVYGLPVSFEKADRLVLFVNYQTEEMPEEGTLVWSILRGVRGTAAGSASLLQEEDDWTKFEEVSESPYFIMTENDDEESGYYRTVELVPAADVAAAPGKNEYKEDAQDWDYYIRAAYYPGTGTDEKDAFYSAATIPFLPQTNAAAAEQTDEDAAGTEEASADSLQDEDSVSENTIDIIEEGISDDKMETEENEQKDASDAEAAEESDSEQPLESSVSENSITDKAAEPEIAAVEDGAAQQTVKENIGVLTLSSESVTLHPDEEFTVSASIVPKDISAQIQWASGDETIAGVVSVSETGGAQNNNEKVKITAKAEGTTQITAECGGLTASVRVEVVPRDEDEVYDLSGDLWVDGFRKESDELVYTGQKITQDFRVYHKETLLREKTDYTLSYKNNVNAAAWNSTKAPSVTITLKGQYSGSVTLYYTIRPADINSAVRENSSGSSAYEQTVAYSKNLKIPNPVLTFANKKLAVKKDFVCDYASLPADYNKGDAYMPGQIYEYTVRGTGNFTGSFTMQLVVLKDKGLNFASASVKLGQKQYTYHGTALSKSDVTIETLTLNKKALDKAYYDYEVCAEGTENAYVMVYPSETGREAGYRGYKKISLKVTGDRNIKDAALGVNWKESIPFSQKVLNEQGGFFQAETGLLRFGNDTLAEGIDYTVKYQNNQKAGTATVTFTGKGRYKGSVRKKYVITPNAGQGNFTFSWKNVTKKDKTLMIAYQKGGAVPDFVLKDQDNNILKDKTDYTVKYKNNKTPGQMMSCEVTGKGNYKGYTQTIQLLVTYGDISQGTLSVQDKPYSTKQNAWKSAVTVTDVNGKKLSAGKDYEKTPAYTYADMDNGQPPRAGTVITVTVKGLGLYEGSVITGTYRIFNTNISKLQIVIDDQEYTGKEVTLEKKDIHVYATAADKKNKRNELTRPCYEIAEYKNNIKAGTAKVTLRGIGDYGGTKTYSFKIQKKTYLKNGVKGIKLDKTVLSCSVQDTEQKRTLTATLSPANDKEALTNPTVIWSSSNSNIAVVESRIVNGTTVAGVIKPKREGSVTITAITQDGNKRAQCKVTISDKLILIQAGRTIQRNVGETYQLELAGRETQESLSDGIVWSSSNPNAVAVSNTGRLTMKKAGAAVITVYKKTDPGYVQQCYAVAIGDEEEPEGSKVLRYERQAGTTDDTSAINRLLREWEWNPDRYECMYIPAGVYRIDAVPTGGDNGFGGIVLTDNQTLILSPGALLIANGNDQANSQVIYAFGRDNITISGGQIIGERNEHTGKGGEWGHGISIVGCTNVTIRDMDISQCWGDGIYLGYYDGPNLCSNGVTIENCNLHDNRRNNLSITDVSNVTVRNCQFNYAKGTDPQFGIDIEPNAGRPCQNINIYDSTFTGNAVASMGIMTAAKDIRIENCTMDGDFINWAGKNVVLKNTTVKGKINDHAGGIKRE
ncbi:MAG: right-handed parallel beta-helix repeat-containing protein [Lachnospiraceae bacterium]|nr:right-handed parallel beta-helix repeat-containing protein [Lachnospiraceae bacterium]